MVGSHTHCWLSTAGPLMTADPTPESGGGVQGAGTGAVGPEHLQPCRQLHLSADPWGGESFPRAPLPPNATGRGTVIRLVLVPLLHPTQCSGGLQLAIPPSPGLALFASASPKP